MKEFSFPIWTLKYILEKETLQTETAVLSEIIDSFCGIANSNNMGAGTTDSDIAMAIGNLALTNGNAANDLQSILTKEKCTQGMAAYLETFENGTLVSLLKRSVMEVNTSMSFAKSLMQMQQTGCGMSKPHNRKSVRLFWSIKSL